MAFFCNFTVYYSLDLMNLMESLENAKMPVVVELPKVHDPRGNLSFIEGPGHVPFDIKRVYYIYDVPGGETRGSHAHKTLQQLLVAVAGSFTVVLEDGINRYEFFLNHPWLGLYIPPGYWRTLDDFSSGAVCMVLASQHYDEEDYIYDHQEFLRYKGLES